MVMIRQSIGNILLKLSDTKDDRIDPALIEQAHQLIDLIKVKVHKYSFDELFVQLRKLSFEIRIQVIEMYVNQGKTINDILKDLNEIELEHHKNSQLDVAIKRAYSIYTMIVDHSGLNLESDKIDYINHRLNNVTYESFEIMEGLASPQLAYVKKWLDQSLDFELALIVADLIKNKEIALSSSRTEKELVPFINDTIIQFGASSIFIKIWTPSNEEDSFIRNMKILAATYELESGLGEPLSVESLTDLIES